LVKNCSQYSKAEKDKNQIKKTRQKCNNAHKGKNYATKTHTIGISNGRIHVKSNGGSIVNNLYCMGGEIHGPIEFIGVLMTTNFPFAVQKGGKKHQRWWGSC